MWHRDRLWKGATFDPGKIYSSRGIFKKAEFSPFIKIHLHSFIFSIGICKKPNSTRVEPPANVNNKIVIVASNLQKNYIIIITIVLIIWRKLLECIVLWNSCYSSCISHFFFIYHRNGSRSQVMIPYRFYTICTVEVERISLQNLKQSLELKQDGLILFLLNNVKHNNYLISGKK